MFGQKLSDPTIKQKSKASTRMLNVQETVNASVLDCECGYLDLSK